MEIRLKFSAIDHNVKATLRELRPLVARVLPGVLDDFYRHVAKFPDVSRLFSDESVMRHAKEMQIKHWDRITNADFDQAYVESVTRIGQAHNRARLARPQPAVARRLHTVARAHGSTVSVLCHELAARRPVPLNPHKLRRTVRV